MCGLPSYEAANTDVRHAFTDCFFALPSFNKRQIFFRIPIFPNSSKYKSNIIMRLGIPYIINPTKIVIVVDI
jgi:hypothetical protein